MAKELPYFKFEPSAWDTGKIQLCVPEVRAVFIDLCSMYWQRLGDLPYKLAVQKICAGNATALDSLYEEGIIKINDGLICIDFLNEQLAEFENLSSKNAENARLGWEKRRKDATAVPPHSERNAIREEKRRKDDINTAKKFSDDYYQTSEEIFEDLKNEYYLEPILLAIKGRGFKACDSVDVLACLKDWILTESPSGELFQKQKKDVRSHFSYWIRKQKPETIAEIGKRFKSALV